MNDEEPMNDEDDEDDEATDNQERTTRKKCGPKKGSKLTSGWLAVLPHKYGPYVIMCVVCVRRAVWLVVCCALRAGLNGLGDSGSIQSRVPDQQ